VRGFTLKIKSVSGVLNTIKKFFERFRKRNPSGLVSVEGAKTGSYLIASTEKPVSYGGIRKVLQDAHLIEASVNPQTAQKIAIGKVGGVSYPDDFNDFQDYLSAYYYVPYVARAVDVKQFMIWQMGYDLESENESSVKKVEEFLKQIEADTVIRDGTLYALIFGNMYWKVEKESGKIKLIPLNPAKMGIKLDREKEKIQEYVYHKKFGKKEHFKPEEIIHLKFNAEPWSLFGVSTLRRVLPTVKAVLFMEEKLPWIARRRADPLLNIKIGSPDNPVSPEQFKRIKNQLLNRKPGEDIFHDGTIEIEEVYKSPGIGPRQAIEPLLKHFRDNLVAGLGVPEPALGFGGTTTMATAEYQERILESEVRSYQRALKRMHEHQLFKLIDVDDVKLVWRRKLPTSLTDIANLVKVGAVSYKQAIKLLQKLDVPVEEEEAE